MKTDPELIQIQDEMFAKFDKNLANQESGLTMAGMAIAMYDLGDSEEKFLGFLTKVEEMVGRVRGLYMDMAAAKKGGVPNDSDV